MAMTAAFDVAATNRFQKDNSGAWLLDQTNGNELTTLNAVVAGDQWTSCDLGSGRVLWMPSDVLVSANHGSQRSLGELKHSALGIQQGYDLSNAGTTLNWYTGTQGDGSIGPIFPTTGWAGVGSPTPYGPACIRWPYSAIKLDDVVVICGDLIIGDWNNSFGAGAGQDQGVGSFMTVCSGIDGTPDTWVQTDVPLGLQMGRPYRGGSPSQMVDGQDGWVYAITTSGIDEKMMMRFKRADLKAGNGMHPQWWDGYQWDYDRNVTTAHLIQGARTHYIKRGRYDTCAPRGSDPAGIPWRTFNWGGVMLRSDGRWLFTCACLLQWAVAPQFTSGHGGFVYAVANSPQGPYGPWINAGPDPFTVPSNFGATVTGNRSTSSLTIGGIAFTSGGWANLVPGLAVSGTGIPANTTITSVAQGFDAINISNMPTIAGSTTLTITPHFGLPYGGLPHPEQTWPGKASDEFLSTFTRPGSGLVFTQPDSSFPGVFRVTGTP